MAVKANGILAVMQLWRTKWDHLFEGNRKDSAEYWVNSFEYLRTAEDPEAMRNEYIGHHMDFFSISVIAQAARNGKVPHSDVTEAVLSMIGVDDDPGDTEVPEDWNGLPISQNGTPIGQA